MKPKQQSPYTGMVITPPDVARTVNEFMRANGDGASIRHWQISRLSLARVAAGLTVHRGTLLAILDGIARLKAAEASRVA